jgi:uncharacterized membrane protein YeaQ/YmgE (transglycosylase-associated protein family)
MSILLFILFGFIIGLLARALMPGRQQLSLLMTAVLGMVGAFVGGFLVKLFTHAPTDRVTPAGFIGSVIGALIVLGIFMAVTRRHHPAT